MNLYAKAYTLTVSRPSPYAILADPVEVPRIASTSKHLVFNYFGPVDASIAAEAAKFLARFTDAETKEAERAIADFLSMTQNDCIGDANLKSACWLTIRLTKPNSNFSTPRWHQDGRMYPYDKGHEDVVRSKYALTLLGPPTLMLVSDELVSSTYRKGLAQHYWWLEDGARQPSDEESDEADLKSRNWFANEFKENSYSRNRTWSSRLLHMGQTRQSRTFRAGPCFR